MALSIGNKRPLVPALPLPLGILSLSLASQHESRSPAQHLPAGSASRGEVPFSALPGFQAGPFSIQRGSQWSAGVSLLTVWLHWLQF